MGFLRSWKQIADYCGRSPDTIKRWDKVLPMPIAKLGRSIQSSPALLDSWLVKAGRTLARENTKGKRLYVRTAKVKPQAPPADLLPAAVVVPPLSRPVASCVQRGNREE